MIPRGFLLTPGGNVMATVNASALELVMPLFCARRWTVACDGDGILLQAPSLDVSTVGVRVTTIRRGVGRLGHTITLRGSEACEDRILRQLGYGPERPFTVARRGTDIVLTPIVVERLDTPRTYSATP